jgi:LysM repeat protein/ABC-type branched-subunit amino acid transport system substrate-binding protein
MLLFLLGALMELQAQEMGTGQKITENGKIYFLYKVQAGETLYSIGKRYNIGLPLLTEINPQVANGLRSGEILKIPVVEENLSTRNEPADNAPFHFISHKVQRKETLYFISRKYGISIDDILRYNPGMAQLKKGDIIRIPQWSASENIKDKTEKNTPVNEGKNITHFVQPGETLYSISRKYGKSVAAILEINPESRELKPGMRLTIPSAQSDLKDTSLDSEGFQEHLIVAGETLYSISMKYDVSADRLVEINPSLQKKCKAGTIIKIPRQIKNTGRSESDKEKEGIKHIVKSGETLYGLSQDYQITMGDIIRDNPFLESRSPRVGDTLYIANSKKTGTINDKREFTDDRFVNGKSRECIPKSSYYSKSNSVKVAMLLPVMVSANKSLNEELLKDHERPGTEFSSVESDSLRTNKTLINNIQFQGNSENFIHFYEGVLLAVDSLQQMGINLELNVWDTEQKSSKVKGFVSSGVLKNADLIIGPVYPNEQKEISEFAEKNRIPVISPLSSSDEYTKDNAFFFQVNPPKEYISEKTNEYLISAYRNSNIVVLQTSSSGNEAEKEASGLKNELEKNNGSTKSTNISICNFRKDGYASLKEKLVKERKNVIVVPSGNEAEVSVVVSNMKTLVADYDITLVGNSRFPQFESINPEPYHDGQLEFLTPYWPDMSRSVTRSFVNKFRSYFKADPDQYSMQGYDVTFFFVKALSDFGPDFRNCISGEKAGLVQGTYHFSRLMSGGYLNKGLSVIQYLPSFEIVRKKVLAE